MSAESWATNEGVARSMRSNRRRDTSLELLVRRELHRRGHRYRVDFAPGRNRRSRADIVFTRHRLVVFLDGCFWHGCDVHYSAPVAHSDFWATKVTANRDRDARTSAALTAEGWRVLRFWEHESVEDIVGQIESGLGLMSSRQVSDADAADPAPR